ncbi:MAG TPA: Fe2+-dependent dioxygenase, partial [Phycisphaerae bacterium]|nr:Fe2+-dependent dioxygenase [Phycisphaerae bacterium]
MLVHIANLLTPQQVAYARQKLDAANWSDGAGTAGFQAKRVKQNRQIDQGDPVGRELGQMIAGALAANQIFMSAAVPLRVLPPRFNRYEGGEHYGAHVDNAIMEIPETGGMRLRADLSMTVFFSQPEEYDGGELRVLDTFGCQSVKLPAGHAILYTATSLHEVMPVTRGVRTCSFFWMQSLVRDDARRTMLFELDQAIYMFRTTQPEHPCVASFINHYHKLLQQWS